MSFLFCGHNLRMFGFLSGGFLSVRLIYYFFGFLSFGMLLEGGVGRGPTLFSGQLFRSVLTRSWPEVLSFGLPTLSSL